MLGKNTYTGSPELQAKCGACNKPAFEDKKLSKCGRCKKVYYHDANCQKKHYPQHKKVCKQMAASFVGIKVVDSGTPLGRVAVSKQTFNPGDVVLAEVPAIVYDTNDNNCFRLFTEYLDAPSDVQASILDMHHNVDTIGGLQNQFLASQVQIFQHDFQHEKKALLTLEIAKKLFSIVNHNAHEYCAGANNAGKVYTYSALPMFESALYTLGSKIEHSCVPNVTMKTTDLGLLQYQALIPIEEEVKIAFSYMSSVYNEPRMARREFLQTNKGFQCECMRCIGFDECNPFKCYKCKEESMFEAETRSGIYCCILCGHEEDRKSELIQKQMKKVNLFRAQIDALLRRLQSGDLDVASDCLELQSEITDNFASPLHWLHPKVLTLISSAFASLARMDMKEGMPPTDPDVAENLRMAGYAELQEVKWIQRIISIAYGWESLKDVVVASKEDAVNTSTGDYGVATISDVRRLINDLIADTTTMRYPNSNVTQEIFRAGQDLVLGGELTEDVSRLFGRYSNDLASMKGLTDKELNSIAVLVDSNGRINQFSNHLL